MANLVAKSLVSADVSGVAVRYRLLDTTRAYALQKLAESGELEAVQRRHAEHHRDLLERAEAEWEAPTAEWLADYGHKINDVRSALNWAFSAEGDASIGVALTIAAIPLWMHLSLVDECRVCVERALASDMARPRSDGDEMKLCAALGAALLYMRGPMPGTGVAWTKALRIAQRINDSEYQLRVLCGLCIHRNYVGDYRAALGFAEQFCSIASEKGDQAARLSGDRLAATALHYLGDQPNARRRLDQMLSQYVAPVHRSHIARFQFDQHVVARRTLQPATGRGSRFFLDMHGGRALLSNILWLQGFPDQAIRTAQNTIEDARAADHALSLCSALVHAACPIALYVGDLVEAERLLAMLFDHVAKHGLAFWNAYGLCLQGMLLLKRGDANGLRILRGALDDLRGMGWGTRYSAYLGRLAHGFGAAGQVSEARAAIEEALEWSERHEERWYTAELLRIKGELLGLQGTAPAVEAAEDEYLKALEWARRQGALSWELRAATSLAQLWHQHGRTREADELLSPLYGRFTEGFETNDLRTARALIDSLRVALR